MTDDDDIQRSDAPSDAPLAQLLREDLDPISVEELHERIACLEQEIARIRAKIAVKSDGLAAAEALFKI